MDMKSQTRLDTLLKYVFQWLGSGAQQKHIGYEVGQAFEALGFQPKLRNLDITFDTYSDPSEQGRKNGKKLMRWLGMDSDHVANRERLFEVEPIIVAAMPEDLRKAYLNDIYGCAGVSVICASQINGEFDPHSLAAAATKESAESVCAMLKGLGPNPTTSDVQNQYREHMEAGDVHYAAAAELKAKYPASLNN